MTKKITMTTLSDAELTKKLVESREALRVLRFEAAGSRPKDTNAPAKLRKEIARALTEEHKRATANTK